MIKLKNKKSLMIYGILIIIIIVPIGISYYYDYKKDPKEFTFSIKTLGKGIVYIGILIGLYTIYELVIPINKNHGIEFNSEREKLGIPKIDDNWENRKYSSNQFITQWWNPKSTDGHFKKVIEYGIINAESETDYYKVNSRKGTFAWSKYDFVNKTTEYFLEKPNDKNISITKTGRLKFEKPTIIQKIDKSEFENYIAE